MVSGAQLQGEESTDYLVINALEQFYGEVEMKAKCFVKRCKKG